MVKVVTAAVIEVIKPSELKVGDKILWANWSRTVLAIKINKFNLVECIIVSNPCNDEEEVLKPYLNYYRIVFSEEEDV